MTDEELIARLRAANAYKGPDFNTPIADPIKVAAADRIEALVKERDEAKRLMQARHREMLAADDLMRKHQRRAERLEAALRLLHDNVVLAFPTLADLGPVANARAALKGDDHE